MTIFATVVDKRIEIWADPVKPDAPFLPEVSTAVVAPMGIPPSVPADQLYYWTAKWQADQAETERELRAGNSRVFGSGQEAVKWLLASTDDD